jgi:hypothetical protein
MLQLASHYGYTDILKKLRKWGLNANDLQENDIWGMSALKYAIKYRNYDVLREYKNWDLTKKDIQDIIQNQKGEMREYLENWINQYI